MVDLEWAQNGAQCFRIASRSIQTKESHQEMAFWLRQLQLPGGRVADRRSNQQGRHGYAPGFAIRGDASKQGLSCSQFNTIVHRFIQLLLAPYIAFRSLHRDMSGEKLDLLQLSSCAVA